MDFHKRLTFRISIDRDCAMALGWVHTLLTTAILNLPESLASVQVKTEAVAAINKVSSTAQTGLLKLC